LNHLVLLVLSVPVALVIQHAKREGRFFDITEAEFEKHNYNPNRIFNVDETGLSVVESKIPEVARLKGKRHIAIMTSAVRGSVVPVIACMSAAGTCVPPTNIFPRKNVRNLLVTVAPPGSLRASTMWLDK
jgi:hypothetical protein